MNGMTGAQMIFYGVGVWVVCGGSFAALCGAAAWSWRKIQEKAEKEEGGRMPQYMVTEAEAPVEEGGNDEHL